jgi:hypothetical protein
MNILIIIILICIFLIIISSYVYYNQKRNTSTQSSTQSSSQPSIQTSSQSNQEIIPLSNISLYTSTLSEPIFTPTPINDICTNCEVFYMNYLSNYTEANDFINKYKIFNKGSGRLATENEVKQAFNDGFSNCNIGWIKDTFIVPQQTNSLYCNAINVAPINSSELNDQTMKVQGIYIYGIKPTESLSLQEYNNPWPWSNNKWSKFDL